jgi:Domain of unknown function (DUF4384)
MESCLRGCRLRLSTLSVVIVLFGTVSILCAQQQRLQVVVEQRVGKVIRQMNPQHVYAAGDFVRFRFRSSFDGYLYVMDQSTSGKYVTLFPDPSTRTSNRTTRDKDYLVPASAGSWFRVDNPPGYETIFFLISPTSLDRESAEGLTPEAPKLTPAPINPPPELLPRCNDAIFQARGDCVDVLAGPRSVPQVDPIPRGLPETPAITSRDLTIINKPTSSVIASAGNDQAPIIYEFRLAHR